MSSVSISPSTRLWLGLLALALVASCSGQGCQGCNVRSIPGGFPAEARVENGAQLRVSRPGLDFLQAEIGNIITGVVGTSLAFTVPQTAGPAGLTVCPGGCNLTVTLGTNASNSRCPNRPPVTSATLTARNGNQLGLNLRLVMSTSNLRLTGPSAYCLGLQGPRCDLNFSTTRAGACDQEVTANINFNVEVNSAGLTTVSLANASLPGLDGSDLNIDGTNTCGDIWCGLANIDFIKDLLAGALAGQIAGLLEDALNGVLCQACQTTEDCPDQTTCGGGTCNTASGKCIPPLGQDGRFDLASVVRGFSPNVAEADLDFIARAGGTVSTPASGLNLGLFGGASSARAANGTPRHAPCVPVRPDLAPPAVPAPRPTELDVNADPDGGSYHLGLGLARLLLDHIGYGAWESGVLCLEVTSEQISQLRSDLLSILVPSLGDLTLGEAVPVKVALRPQTPPTFTLGANTSHIDDMTGNRVVDDPLINVRLEGLAVDIYALVAERYTRIMTINADLNLPMGLDVDSSGPTSQLVLLVGDISQGLTNLSVTNSELLAEDPAALAMTLPTILGFAIGQLAQGSLASFDLPSFMGFNAVPTRVPAAIASGEVLGLFMNLSFGQPQTTRALTRARVTQLKLPTTAQFSVTELAQGGARPEVHLELDGTAPGDGELEWTYRINGGYWHPFTPSRRLIVRDPELLLQGWHTVDVRARQQGAPHTLDYQGVQLKVLIDTVAPAVSLSTTGGQVTVVARDAVSADAALRYQFRVGQGAWSEPSPSSRFGAPADARVEVRVLDEAGNVGRALLNPVQAPVAETPAAGCGVASGRPDATDTSSALGFLLLAGLALMGATARRFRPFAGTLTLLTALGLVAGGCGGDPGLSGLDSIIGSDQQVLVDRLSCSDDMPCPDGQICRLGACEPAPECEADDQCPNRFCCLQSRRCQDIPPPDCGDAIQCPNGMVPRSTGGIGAGVERTTCRPTTGDCECVKPLSEGTIGRYSDLASFQGQVFISAYDESYGDLVFGRRAPDDSLQFESVDGIPDGPVVGDPQGWRRGVEAKGDDVGRWTSLGFSAAGDARIAYFDNTNRTLKLAAQNGGAWDIEVVDQAAGLDIGRFASMTIGPDGKAGIFYIANGLRAGNQVMGELRYAEGNPGGPWTISTVDQVPIPCGGFCAQGEACVAADNSCATVDTAGCGGGCDETSQCIGGACVEIVATPTAVDVPRGVGLYTLSRRVGAGAAALYYDRENGDLKLAQQMASGFELLSVEDVGDVGVSPTMVIQDGEVHFAYRNVTSQNLIYGELTTGLREVIDDGVRLDGQHVVGDDAAMVIDAQGTVRVAYQDATTQDIWYARRNAPGDWQRDAIAGMDPSFDGSHGFYTRHIINGDTALVSSFRINNQVDPPVAGLTILEVP